MSIAARRGPGNFVSGERKYEYKPYKRYVAIAVKTKKENDIISRMCLA